MKIDNVRMMDISTPQRVTVELDYRRNVLYVHVDGITALRVQRSTNSPKLEIRKSNGEEINLEDETAMDHAMGKREATK